MIDIETLRRGAARWKVELDETALSRFDRIRSCNNLPCMLLCSLNGIKK